VHGPDAYMLDVALDALRDAVAPEGLNDFNYDFFRGRDVDGDVLRSACEMLPMMSRRKLVLVRDAQEINPKELESLEEYFKDPAPSTCLVFHAFTADKSLDGRLKGVKLMRKAANEFELKGFYENELDDVLAREAKRKGLQLDRAGTAYLVEAVGTDLGELVRALEKVSLYVGARPDSGSLVDASYDDVREIIAETRVHNVFKLTEMLGQRDFEASLHALDGMLSAGEPALRITSMIARHFRIVDKLHDPEIRRASRNDKARAVGVVPFFLKDYERDANRFSIEDCRHVRKLLLEVDTGLKSSRLPDRAIMEHLLYRICQRPDRRAHA
jgi:DNA polymerase-3 subunit delta